MKQQLRNLVDRKVLLERMQTDEERRTTISFYQYAHILNPPSSATTCFPTGMNLE